MAAASSIQTTTTGSIVQHCGLSRSGGDGFTNSLRRSQFLGSGRISVPPRSVTSKQAAEQARKKGLKAVRSASFFERLGQVFFPSAADKEQVFAVYEINELDRNSPAYLRLTPYPEIPTKYLGDLVPYTNKVYGPSGTDYLGISAGICAVIAHDAAVDGDFYETTYTHYIGKYGQISAMGPFYSYQDSEMAVTGGTGIFKGARGVVKIRNVEGTLKLLYTYYITGVSKLPPELTRPVVPLQAAKPVAAESSPVTVST